MLFQVYCCYNHNKNYVFLTLRMLKLQYTMCYFNYIMYCNHYNENYVANSDFRNVKITINSMLLQLHYVATVIITIKII